MKLRPPTKELLELSGHSTRALAERIDKLALRIASVHMGRAKGVEGPELDRLTRVLAETMTLADLMGRRRVLLHADRLEADGPETTAEEVGAELGETPVKPKVDFSEVLDDLLGREVRLAERGPGNVPLYLQVQEMYRTKHAFAVARSITEATTKRVQAVLHTAMEKGEPPGKPMDILSEMQDFSSWYSETVYRTNLSTAYMSGKFQQQKKPSVQRIIGAFELVPVIDNSTRGNHSAMESLLAASGHPIWRDYAPPLGYNCRCDVREVSRFELKRAGVDLGSDARFRGKTYKTLGSLKQALAGYRVKGLPALPDKGFGKRTGGGLYAGMGDI